MQYQNLCGICSSPCDSLFRGSAVLVSTSRGQTREVTAGSDRYQSTWAQIGSWKRCWRQCPSSKDKGWLNHSSGYCKKITNQVPHLHCFLWSWQALGSDSDTGLLGCEYKWAELSGAYKSKWARRCLRNKLSMWILGITAFGKSADIYHQSVHIRSSAKWLIELYCSVSHLSFLNAIIYEIGGGL